jgi:hypothetical protein
MPKLRCPSCYSTELVRSGYYRNSYTCKRCGYSGRFVIEIEDESVLPLLKKFNKNHPHTMETPHPTQKEKTVVLLGVLFYLLIIVVAKFHLLRYVLP